MICWVPIAALADIHTLYGCHDRLLEHKQAVFDHLVGRWRDLFNVSFDVLLYDLTSTYFESDPPADDEDKRRHGYSRDHRPDCVQVVIALVVTPEGLPLAYEVLAGNTRDCTTLKDFLERIERRYGKARRVWCMDRGIPTEEVLAQMRDSDPPVHYLVGTPKGRLTRLEEALLGQPWHIARPEVRVKLLAQDSELYVFAESRERIAKERSMRRRQLKWLWARLKKLLTATTYLTALTQGAGTVPRITDKLLTNYFFVGLIHLLFPNAKIINTMRDPVDTCLSAFTKLFKDDMPHSYDMGELGRYYAQYAKLMEHWTKVLPKGVMTTIAYEDMVADTETEAKRLIAFLGLEWDAKCLDFHNSDRPVKTASVAQVRKPIYSSAVKRHKKYGAGLKPLADAIKAG